jgi:hypothetical protein
MKALKIVLLLFVASRLMIFAVLSIGQSDSVVYVDHQLKLDNPVVDRFILYDSYNYAQIATEGYSEDRLTAFFPLFPLIVHGFVTVTGFDVYWAGFIMSNFFFVCSLWLLYRLMTKRGLSERVKMITLSVLSFFPSSYFFSAFYTESFFLFLALSAFLCWGNNRRGAAYFIGGLAALTRIVGVWIPLAFFAERWIRRKLDVKDFAYAWVSSLMFLLYPAYLWLTKGDPMLFIKVQADYFRRITAFPFSPIYRDLATTVNGKIEPIILFHMTLILVFLGYLAWAIRQRYKGTDVPWSEFVYTFGLIATPLCSMVQSVSISSHGLMRYFLTVFPLFIFLGNHLDKVFRRENRNIGRSLFLVWKSVVYFVLFLWVVFLIQVLSILRYKGFVA